MKKRNLGKKNDQASNFSYFDFASPLTWSQSSAASILMHTLRISDGNESVNNLLM
jgi:hypothetical protein